MSITVNDPGFQNGRIVNKSAKYSVEIIKDGAVTQVIDVYPLLYPIFLTGYIVLQTNLLIVAMVFSDLSATFSWGGALVTLQLIHFAMSLKYVKEDELGGLLFYGTPVRRVSGLSLVIFGIFTLRKLPKKLNQDQFPGDPEKVWKASDEKFFELPKEQQAQFVLPIRALTAAPKKATGYSILNTQMTIEVTFYVKWTIEQFWVFLVRIGTVVELVRQLRDSGERVLVQQVATRTPGDIQQQLGAINDILCKELEKITQDSGISINEAAMLSPDLTHGVNAAMRDIAVKKAEGQQTVITAGAMAEATVLKADADKQRLSLEGDGVAHANLVNLEALAKGAQALNVDGQHVVDLEKAKALAAGDPTVFVDGGNNLFGLGARVTSGVKAALNQGSVKSK